VHGETLSIIEAACSSLMPCGSFTIRSAGTMRASQYEPGRPV